MRRWIILLALLPSSNGCLYYAYPTVTHTPEIAVENRDNNAHAFRVDIDHTERKPAPTTTQYTLAQIPIGPRGVIPSQLEVAPATGVYNPLGVAEGSQHERNQYTMTVRLYKPGSRTMEVKAWDKARSVDWSPAPALIDQERALDDLLAVPATPDRPAKATWWELKDEKALQPGGASTAQKKTLDFAANEYSRLANSVSASAPGNQIVRERLQQKAIWLKRHAEQP